MQALGRLQKAIPVILLFTLALTGLSGCLRIRAEDLYRLPQASEDYLKLQENINNVLNLGAEYSPPISGPNRQSVQLRDLNGDGSNEVIAFFNTPHDSKLSIYIFRMVDGDYAIADVIEGVGAAFESVRYVDLDGDGVLEIIVGRQEGAALKHMSIYSVKDYPAVQLASREYLEINVFDINSDGNGDIILFRLPSQETGMIAETLSLMPDGEVVSEETRLSVGIDRILRVMNGKLSDGAPAVFVDSEGRFEDGGLITDILAFRDGVFTNISMEGPDGISRETVRARLNSTDINKNGVIEVPMPRLLKAQSETPYYAIDWYAFNIFGKSNLALTTYHNINDEWFLILPLDWRGKVSIRREDVVMGERTVIFSYIAGPDGPYEDFLKIYKISGNMREERAQLAGRVLLMSEGAAVYAFELLAQPNSFGLTFSEKLVRDNFRLLYSEWLSGIS